MHWPYFACFQGCLLFTWIMGTSEMELHSPFPICYDLHNSSQLPDFDCRCPFFHCNNYETHHNETHHNKTNDFFHTREMCFTIFSLAALLSYSIFLICFKIASTSQDSVMMSPSKSLMDDVIDRKEITLLFFAFIIIMASFLSGMVLLFIFEFKNVHHEYIKHIPAIATTVVLTHWASFNTCHVFAISSFSLGKYLVKYVEGVQAYLITFILEENKI